MGPVLAFGAGFLVWWAAPTLTGTPYPWDATWPFYPLVMAGAGALLSPLRTRPSRCWMAAWLGQLTALFALPFDRGLNVLGKPAWWVLGFVATGVGSFLLWGGWLLAGVVRGGRSRQ